jgi:hypothetical protein
MADGIVGEVVKVASIFALAFFSFWPAIPAGLALGLAPVTVVATTTLSYAAGAALVALFGGAVREWVLRRVLRSRERVVPSGWLDGMLRRYGLVGLGMAAPMTVGAQIGAVIGLTLDMPPRRLFLWLTMGALAWSVLLTVGVLLGVLGTQALVSGG